MREPTHMGRQTPEKRAAACPRIESRQLGADTRLPTNSATSCSHGMFFYENLMVKILHKIYSSKFYSLHLENTRHQTIEYLRLLNPWHYTKMTLLFAKRLTSDANRPLLSFQEGKEYVQEYMLESPNIGRKKTPRTAKIQMNGQIDEANICFVTFEAQFCWAIGWWYLAVCYK